MKKILLVTLAMMLSSCNKFKEQQLKTILGEKKEVSLDELIVKADQSATYENLTAVGLSYSQAKNPEAAIKYFEKALLASPKSAVAMNNCCAENNNMGHYENAIKYCEQALIEAKDFQLAKNNLKFALNKKAAQQIYIQELQSKVESTKGSDRQAVMIDLGLVFYKMGQFEDAVSVWKKIPDSGDALFAKTLSNLSSAYIIMKKFDLAKTSLDEASKLDPQNQLIKNNISWLKSAEASLEK